MKRIALLIALLPSLAFAQQPTIQGTPAGPNTPVFNGWRKEGTKHAKPQTVPTSWAKVSTATHTVRMEGSGGEPRGSGTLVNWQGCTHVLSCRHLDWPLITHANWNGKRLAIADYKVSKDSDVAIVCLRDPSAATGVDIAQRAVEGDQLTLTGFPFPTFAAQSRRGRITQRHNSGFYISALANFGDSGGSVYDSTGRVAGVLVGKKTANCRRQQTFGSCKNCDDKPGSGSVVSAREVHRFLGRAQHVHTNS